jgi:hypothetical protein
MSCHQNTGQDHAMQIANKFFENVAKFECLEMTQTKITFMKKLRGD